MFQLDHTKLPPPCKRMLGAQIGVKHTFSKYLYRYVYDKVLIFVCNNFYYFNVKIRSIFLYILINVNYIKFINLLSYFWDREDLNVRLNNILMQLNMVHYFLFYWGLQKLCNIIYISRAGVTRYCVYKA